MGTALLHALLLVLIGMQERRNHHAMQLEGALQSLQLEADELSGKLAQLDRQAAKLRSSKAAVQTQVRMVDMPQGSACPVRVAMHETFCS